MRERSVCRIERVRFRFEGVLLLLLPDEEEEEVRSSIVEIYIC